jgi:cyanophycinase
LNINNDEYSVGHPCVNADGTKLYFASDMPGGFGGTDIYQVLHDRYFNEEKFVIAGTSAGAMAMSNTMIYSGKSELAHLKGEVKITTGLAFIPNVIIDSHFDKRGRFNRLAQAVASNPQCTAHSPLARN